MSVVDTNILVHATVSASPMHDTARRAILRLAASGPVAITRQIMREYVAVVTRPQSWAAPASIVDAVRTAGTLARRFAVLEDGPGVWAEFEGLAQSKVFGGKQVHDAYIVAAMLAHGETDLLTLNASDFDRFGDRIRVMAP